MYKYKKFTCPKRIASKTLSAHHYFGKPMMIQINMIYCCVVIFLAIHISIFFANSLLIPETVDKYLLEETFFKIGCHGTFNEKAVQFFYDACVRCSEVFHRDFLSICSTECFINNHYLFGCLQYEQSPINWISAKCALNELQGENLCSFEQKLFD